MIIFSIIVAILVVAFISIAIWVISLRRVVSTNEVHIVQRSNTTISYGKDEEAGNTYYAFPSVLPKIGIQVITFPVSVFSEQLNNYEAYDQGRLPFSLDMEAFFRIDNSNVAAQRVASFQELRAQLRSILQGAARTILASKSIEEIMQGRAEFGIAFTQEVKEQLKSWGVIPVKSIELMDIRDSRESRVIANIMEKKKSFIEMQSRIEVAENKKTATNAEIDAERAIKLNQQVAEQQIGIRTAEKEKEVGLATEISIQQVKEQQKLTTEKELAIVRVQQTRAAEIRKEVEVIQAEQQKQTDVIQAEGNKAKTILEAEALLESKKKESEGIQVEGEARANAEEKMQLAPVNAQITLAREIGDNEGYQKYLITIEQVNANRDIGIEQAKALHKADVKVIVNSGNVSAGIDSIQDVFTTSQGGQGVASMLEGLAQTELGQKVIEKFVAPKTK